MRDEQSTYKARVKYAKPHHSTRVLFDMLDRVDNLVHELQGYTGNDTLGVREGALQSAQRYACFLRRHPREKLRDA